MAKNRNSFAGKSFQQIMIQQASQSMSEATYCRYCGQDIKQPSQKSTQQDGGSWSSPWELENNAHVKCYQENRFNQYYGR